MTSTGDAVSRRDALVERLFQASLASMDLLGVYLGTRLGLYAALSRDGALTSSELAMSAGVNERYGREWLEQQAATGLLVVDDPAAGAEARRYTLPAGHDEALLDEGSLNYAAPMAWLLVACTRPLDDLLKAFRSGEGIPFDRYGADAHEGQAAFTRPMFEQLLGSEWFPAVPDLDARLRAEPPARVADLACGQGRSSIAITRAYPNVRVDGIDSDEASINAAQANLIHSGVEDRVSFRLADAAHLDPTGGYDVVHIFESLHDMSHPVEVLTAARGCSPTVVPCSSATSASVTCSPPADDLERFCYGFSILHCLPVGMVGADAVGTGTVMRSDTVRRYATASGLSGFEILPVENDFYRYYRLTP
jgi:SAM-dependent methyltransferase